jgi:hypothetical protein
VRAGVSSFTTLALDSGPVDPTGRPSLNNAGLVAVPADSSAADVRTVVVRATPRAFGVTGQRALVARARRASVGLALP